MLFTGRVSRGSPIGRDTCQKSTARTVGINAHGDMSSGSEHTQPGNPSSLRAE